MKMNPILALEKFGQSIWLDYIRRELIQSGQLEKMILVNRYARERFSHPCLNRLA